MQHSLPLLLCLVLSVFAISTDPTPITGTVSDTVSWQSIFLGLVPLVLNSMTQPSVLDGTFPQSSLLFAARCSPFICLADSLDIIFSYTVHIYQGRGIQDAAVLISWRRARYRLGRDLMAIESSPAEQHRNTYAILQIGTLLQAIKIWGSIGIPWSKAWATIYMSSFLIMWALELLCPEGWRDRPSSTETERDLSFCTAVLIVFAGLAQIFLWEWTIYQFFHINLDHHSILRHIAKYLGNSLIIVGTMIVVAFPAVWVMLGSFQKYREQRPPPQWPGRPPPGLWEFKRDESKDWSAQAAILSMIVIPVSVYLWLGEQRCFLIGDIALQGTAMLVLASVIAGAGMLVGIMLRSRVPSRFLAANGMRYHLLSIFFAWVNFFMAFFYYRFRYSEEGTAKPSWTENLG